MNIRKTFFGITRTIPLPYVVVSITLIPVIFEFLVAPTYADMPDGALKTCTHSAKNIIDGNEQMVWVEGGKLLFGSNAAYSEEASEHEVTVDGFWIKAFEVTNHEFGAFVSATNYKTVAETYLDKKQFPDIPDEQRVPGSVVFVPPASSEGSITQWWQFIPGANWRHPDGPDSSILGKEHYPVVHVTYDDAQAYAKWKGHDLPTEQQWEYAAKGKFQKTKYAWGDSLTIKGKHQANTWQGIFPLSNSRKDGYVGRAPVGCYPANDNGLYDMIGNVWEWTASWYFPGHQTKHKSEQGFDPNQAGIPVKVMKGGSFLCAANFCQRYRPSARHAQDISLGSSHIGFRTVKNN